MALSTALFGGTIYALNNYSPAPQTVAGNHNVHDPANSRATVALAPVPNSAISSVTFTTDPTGDTIYLPYTPDRIHSVILAAAPPAGVTGFVTANMSGCRLYVDRAANGDLVVYHANILVPGGGANPMMASVETVPQAQGLDGLHVAARGHYTAAPHNMALAGVASVGSPLYRRAITREVARKQDDNRTNVQYQGGTTIAGEFIGGAWRIHWQTFAYFDYRRPANSPKGWVKGRDVAHAITDLEIVEHGRIV